MIYAGQKVTLPCAAQCENTLSLSDNALHASYGSYTAIREAIRRGWVKRHCAAPFRNWSCGIFLRSRGIGQNGCGPLAIGAYSAASNQKGTNSNLRKFLVR